MKYSTTITNENIFFQPFEKILDTLIAAGFDAVDIPGDPEQYPIAKIKPILETYSNKLKVAELTACMNPTRDLVHPNSGERKKALDYVKYCIQAAADLGVKLTHMCFLSYNKNLTETPQKLLEDLGVKAISECYNYARDRGVRLLIEPLFKGDVSIVNRCDQAVALYSKVLKLEPVEFLRGVEDAGLLLDIFHMHHEEPDLLESLKKYGKVAYHVHVADHPRSLDFTRPDSGFVKQAMKQLKAQKYAHYISFESFDPGVTLTSLSGSLKMLKSYEKAK